MITITCDSCGNKINKKEGHGQFNHLTKIFSTNLNLKMPNEPQYLENEYHLCFECAEKIQKEFLEPKKETPKTELVK